VRFRKRTQTTAVATSEPLQMNVCRSANTFSSQPITRDSTSKAWNSCSERRKRIVSAATTP